MRSFSNFTELTLSETILILSALDARAHELKRMAALDETQAEACSEIIAFAQKLHGRLETEIVTFGLPLLVKEGLA